MMSQVSPMAPIPSAMRIPESITSPMHVTTRARVVEKHELTKPAIAERARISVEPDVRLGLDAATSSRVSIALAF